MVELSWSQTRGSKLKNLLIVPDFLFQPHIISAWMAGFINHKWKAQKHQLSLFAFPFNWIHIQTWPTSLLSPSVIVTAALTGRRRRHTRRSQSRSVTDLHDFEPEIWVTWRLHSQKNWKTGSVRLKTACEALRIRMSAVGLSCKRRLVVPSLFARSSWDVSEREIWDYCVTVTEQVHVKMKKSRL